MRKKQPRQGLLFLLKDVKSVQKKKIMEKFDLDEKEKAICIRFCNRRGV